MPLNAGDTAFVAAPSTKLTFSESTPLLVTHLEPRPAAGRWVPLTTEELEAAAGGPGWRKMRCYLLLLFWLVWAAMLAGSVAVVATSPRPVLASLTWWQRSLFYRVQPDLFAGKEDTPGDFSGEALALVRTPLNQNNSKCGGADWGPCRGGKREPILCFSSVVRPAAPL